MISLTIDPDAIDVLEARTPDEGPVLRLDIEERELRVELTAVEPGESATFELSLLADGETIETTVVSLEC